VGVKTVFAIDVPITTIHPSPLFAAGNSDAVQELVINQNVYSAEYGRAQEGSSTSSPRRARTSCTWCMLYNINRAYDAADNQEHANIANGSATDKRRFDFNRVAATSAANSKRQAFPLWCLRFNKSRCAGYRANDRRSHGGGYTQLNTLAANSKYATFLRKCLWRLLPIPWTRSPSMAGNPAGEPIPSLRAS